MIVRIPPAPLLLTFLDPLLVQRIVDLEILGILATTLAAADSGRDTDRHWPRHVITFFSCDVPLPPTASSDSFPKSSFSFSAHGAFYGDLFSVRVAGFS
jgi:hypothetical protein